MKIAIVVHGRFHAFDLACALLKRGHDVTLFTNYPKWAVGQFDFPSNRVRSFWVHGVLSRFAWALHQRRKLRYPEWWLHPLFGRWAAKELSKEKWDVIHPWSGIAEEILCAEPDTAAVNLLMRGSAHIRTQAQLLREEKARTGAQQDHPSSWMISREEREYALADGILALSTFAYHTFVAEGTDPKRLYVLPLAASTEAFRPTEEIVKARCKRIVTGEPLRVLYVGALSFRKGMWDIEAILNGLNDEEFRFRFIGPVSPETVEFLARLKGKAEFVSKQPQHSLSRWYAQGDVFIFPTIEDGYAQVLAQAHANALPILTTTNSGGPDLIREGETGWIAPIRSPDAFVDRLRWCASHRREVAAMVRRLYYDYRPRDWANVATDFEGVCLEALSRRREHGC